MKMVDWMLGRKYLKWDEYQRMMDAKEQKELYLRLQKRELKISK